jgi:D-beta-D-heptose 7-phosphate kinase/D-beta-D-heptose 1-phosphate adenosyltransferase
MSTWPAPQYVFTNGCYDLLHAGHLATLTCAKAQGDKVIVALNSDESVRRLKGDGRPLVPLADRLRMVAALSVVDYVVSFDEDTPRELIAHLRPHVLVKGGDYRAEDVVGADLVDRVIIAPTLPGRSTSRLAVALEV